MKTALKKIISHVLAAGMIVTLFPMASFAAANYSEDIITYDFSAYDDNADLYANPVEGITVKNIGNNQIIYGTISTDDGKLVLYDSYDGTGFQSVGADVAFPVQTGKFSLKTKLSVDGGAQIMRMYGRLNDGTQKMITNLDISYDTEVLGVKKYAYFIYSPGISASNRIRIPNGSTYFNPDYDYTVQVDIDFATQTYDVTVTSDAFIGLSADNGATITGNVYSRKSVKFFETQESDPIISAHRLEINKAKMTGYTYFDYFDVKAAARYNLSGVVKDDDNFSLAGASVRIYDSNDSTKTTVASTTTDALGGFSFSNVYAGEYVVEASLEDYGTVSNYVNLTENITNLSLKVVEGAILFEDFDDKNQDRNLYSSPLPGITISNTNYGSVIVDEFPASSGNFAAKLIDTDNTTSNYGPMLTVQLTENGLSTGTPVQGRSYVEFDVLTDGNLFVKSYAKNALGTESAISSITFPVDGTVGAFVRRPIWLYSDDKTSPNVFVRIPDSNTYYDPDKWYRIRMEFDTTKNTYDISIESDAFANVSTVVEPGTISGNVITFKNFPMTPPSSGVPADATGGLTKLTIGQGKGLVISYVDNIKYGRILPAEVKSVSLFKGTDLVTDTNIVPIGLSTIKAEFKTKGSAINGDTVTNSNVKVNKVTETGTYISTVVTDIEYDPESITAEISVLENLEKGGYYQLVVSDGVKTEDGYPVTAYSFDFAAENSLYDIISTDFKIDGVSGSKSDLATGKSLTAGVNFVNNKKGTFKLAVILAELEDGCLARLTFNEQEFNSSDSSDSIWTDELAVPDNYANIEYKLFIWESMDNMKPVHISVPLR